MCQKAELVPMPSIPIVPGIFSLFSFSHFKKIIYLVKFLILNDSWKLESWHGGPNVVSGFAKTMGETKVVLENHLVCSHITSEREWVVL